MSAYPYHVQNRLFEAQTIFVEEQLTTPQQLDDLVRPMLRDLEQEHLLCICLNAKSHRITVEVVSKGSLNCTMMHPRDVFRIAIRENASAIALAHNHPSGDPEPSSPDKTLTRRLVEAGELLQIPVVDHLIVGRKSFVSLAETHPNLFSLAATLNRNRMEERT